jgi:5-(carboxyamino)imidazole ribonucleotide mutase
MIASGDPAVMEKLVAYKESLKQKIVKANEEQGAVKYRNRTN